MALGGGILLGVDASGDLLRVYDALKYVSDDVQRRTFDAANQQLAAGWKEELAARSGYNTATKKVITADPSVTAHTLGLTVATGGTGPLAALTRPFEFGTLRPDDTRRYKRNNRSGTGSHWVTRKTQRQIPSRSTRGWVAYPAAGKLSTRAFKMFLQIIVKTAHDAIDGGR